MTLTQQTSPYWPVTCAGTAIKLLEAINNLSVTIESVSTHQLSLQGGMKRIRTIVELHGKSQSGCGEDIAYFTDTQNALPAALKAAESKLVGTWTIKSFSDMLDTGLTLDLPNPPSWDDKSGYHRWAIESAVLDLALRQANTNLAELIGVSWNPLRTSLSMGLSEDNPKKKLEAWLERDPNISFKLDVSTWWDKDLITALASLGSNAISTIDFKALYKGSWADNDYPPQMYTDVAQLLPQVLIEDADLTQANREALGSIGLSRLSWDFPITCPEDIPGLSTSTTKVSDLRPAAINIKPSRFGSLSALLKTIDLCDKNNIPCYSGGQFELGVGRTQVQSISSLCFPTAANDCAPVMFHQAEPSFTDVPLGDVIVPTHTGFGWDTPTRAVVI